VHSWQNFILEDNTFLSAGVPPDEKIAYKPISQLTKFQKHVINFYFVWWDTNR